MHLTVKREVVQEHYVLYEIRQEGGTLLRNVGSCHSIDTA